jgi:hypothetical protein
MYWMQRMTGLLSRYSMLGWMIWLLLLQPTELAMNLMMQLNHHPQGAAEEAPPVFGAHAGAAEDPPPPHAGVEAPPLAPQEEEPALGVQDIPPVDVETQG